MNLHAFDQIHIPIRFSVAPLRNFVQLFLLILAIQGLLTVKPLQVFEFVSPLFSSHIYFRGQTLLFLGLTIRVHLLVAFKQELSSLCAFFEM